MTLSEDVMSVLLFLVSEHLLCTLLMRSEAQRHQPWIRQMPIHQPGDAWYWEEDTCQRDAELWNQVPVYVALQVYGDLGLRWEDGGGQGRWSGGPAYVK